MNPTETARAIIANNIYITIATVSAGGEPWNTPVSTAHDEDFNFFWISAKDSQHSQNIRDRGSVFAVIFDSTAAEGTGTGVFMQASAYELNDPVEMAHALKCLSDRKQKIVGTIEQFLGDYPRRIYTAVPSRCWINGDSTINGHFVDRRIEVDLLG